MTTTRTPTDTSRIRLAAVLIFMGALHVVVPKPFEKIIPKALGAPRFWNLLAAACEATAGGLLLSRNPARRRLGGWLATVTFVGVFPANIDMAVQAGPPTTAPAIGAWARLPLQIPIVRWAYRHTA